MGRDKARLELPRPDGRTLTQVAHAALQATCSEVLVVGRDPADCLGEALELLADERPGLGPLGGLVTGLRRAGGEFCLLLACDLPEVQSPFLTALQEEATAKEGRLAVIPRGPLGLEPMVSAWPTALLPALDDYLESGERAIHPLVGRGLARVWDCEPLISSGKLPDPFRNLNRPEQWSAYLADRFPADAD